MTPPGSQPRLRALGVPRHDCRHASACCSSYSVGPLLDDDRLRVQAILPAVRRAFPDQPIDDPFVTRTHQGEEAVFLSKVNGSCCFWRADVGCSIHNVASSETKPLVCQLFPLQLIAAGDELRVGVRPTCLEDHSCWRDGPPVDGALLERLVADRRSFLRREEPAGEDVALRLASVPDLDTGSILSFVAGRARDEVPAVEGWIEERLAAVLDEVDAIGEAGPVHPRTATAALLADFRAWHASRRSAGSWPEVPAQGLPWFRDALGRLLFLRQTSLHPSVPWALIAYVTAARLAAAWADDGGWVPERFGRGFSTWLILLENPRLQRVLVSSPPPFDAPTESTPPAGGSAGA